MFIHFWQEHILIQPFWKAVWHYVSNTFKMFILFKPAILSRAIFSKVILFPNSRGLFCLHTSKPKQTPTEFCSRESKGLFKEIVPSPETQVSSCSKTWLLDGLKRIGCYRRNLISNWGSWGSGFYWLVWARIRGSWSLHQVTMSVTLSFSLVSRECW